MNVIFLRKALTICVLNACFLGFQGCDDGPIGGILGSDSYEEKNVGFAAADLLGDEDFSVLEIELISMPGMEPTSSAKNYLISFLSDRLHKNDIILIERGIPSQSNTPYSVDAVLEVEKDFRTSYNRDDTLTASFLFVDQAFSGNSGNAQVLGIAYRSTSMVIFESTVQSNSGGPLQPSTSLLESTVIAHEFGHILGLVDIGSPMVQDHQDEPNGAHCDEEDCLMYYTVQTTESLSNLIGGSVPELDAQCIADLQANGGK